MDLKQLHSKLKAFGISKEKYYLHGLYGSKSDDNKLSLVKKQGKHGIEYVIYFKERGEKHSIKSFNSEDEACQYFYNRVKKNKEIEDKYSR